MKAKMSKASSLAQQHLDEVARKANAENSKVLEINFINAITKEEFTSGLAEKLRDTEDRITKARERRMSDRARKASRNERRR